MKSKHRYRYRKRKSKTPAVVRVVLLLIAVGLCSGPVLAKYFVKDEQKVSVVAKNFYFESDMLSVSTGTVPQYTLQAGVDTISFSLMNYPDELRTSEVDIEYSVVLTKDGTEITSTSGELAAGKTSVPIAFHDLAEGVYTVTADATSPYTETLQGKFTVVDTDHEVLYTVNDGSGSPNLKVTVTTTDYSGNVVIEWPVGVLPDNTDPHLKTASGQSCTVKVNSHSQYTFQFFKTDPTLDYTDDLSAFRLTKGGAED